MQISSTLPCGRLWGDRWDLVEDVEHVKMSI